MTKTSEMTEMLGAIACEIHELKMADLPELKRFTDREIGAGYYSERELIEIFERSWRQGRTASLVLKHEDRICGLPSGSMEPGQRQWPHAKALALSAVGHRLFSVLIFGFRGPSDRLGCEAFSNFGRYFTGHGRARNPLPLMEGKPAQFVAALFRENGI